jgi:dTDP-4-dehydrorhamnose reductase
MKILLTGKDGQVGFALHKKLISLGEVIATGRHELDLVNPDAIKTIIDKIKPDMIINPAAYTQVDKAESEKSLAHKINTLAPKILAEAAKELNIPIIHFSTDYVFDGLKNEPYLETDKTNPQSVYGQSKWEGEQAVRNHKKHIILRTSWVFSHHGQNFLKTILKLVQEKTSLYVVNDQIGAPTSSNLLADVTFSIVKVILNDINFKYFGTYHVTSIGDTDRFQYACFIVDEAINLGFKTLMTSKDIKPISTDFFSTLAKRSSNSRLYTDKITKTFMLELPHWKMEVKRILKELVY